MNVEAALFHTVSEWGLSIYLPLNIMERSGLGIQITFVFYLGKKCINDDIILILG